MENIARGYRHALCQFELSDHTLACLSLASRGAPLRAFGGAVTCLCVYILSVRVRSRVAAPCDTELLGTRAAKHTSARASDIKHSPQARRLSSSTAIERVSAAPAAPGDLIPFKTKTNSQPLRYLCQKREIFVARFVCFTSTSELAAAHTDAGSNPA